MCIKKIKGFVKWFKERYKIRYWNLAFIYALFIILLSSMPIPPSPEHLVGLSFSNTFKHIILYMGFGLCLGIAFRHSPNKNFSRNSYLWAIVFGILFAVFDEYYQGFHSRTTDGLDMIADSFGVAIAQAFRWFLKMEEKWLHKIF